ncbi:MAG TPA: TIGR03936 family radical SAM-associated protein [Pirellulales bacterium]|nr:TIGR03936 family radical SAM-associated protein [Pirellulales bacterium]
MVRRRVRIRFRKQGDLRWIGHLDLLRAWERLLRRACVPLVMTEGCHPRPRINLLSALPMGEAGLDEMVEVDFSGPQTTAELLAACEQSAPAGLTVTEVDETSPVVRGAQLREMAYEVPLPAERREDVTRRVAEMIAAPTLAIARAGEPAIDLRDLLMGADVSAGVLRFRIRASRERNLRAKDVLAALGLDDLRAGGIYPTRTQLVLES